MSFYLFLGTILINSRFIHSTFGILKNHNKSLNIFKMSSTSSFNRADFQQTVQLVGVKIPNKEVNKITQQFKRHLFVRPRIKRVYEVENDQDKRIVLLSETYSDTSLHSILDTDFKTYLESIKADPVKYPLQLTYEHQSVEEILTKVLPSGVEIPSSYEQVGHIAHLNLRDQVLPFKTIVGQVLLDKNPSLRTVVNKIGSIETEFRTFPMEVIAGESVFEVTVRESGAIFNFNFQNVYWNSRLQTEHSRMIDWIRESSSLKKVADNNQKTIVADMMAGVGPFAVPLAMSSAIQVHANDLNPESYKYLVVNTKTNKCGRNLFNYNLDGRDFLMQLARDKVMPHEVIMNLPASATDFLDVFIGYGRRYEAAESKAIVTMPRIHVYGFSVASDSVSDMTIRAAAVLQCEPADICVRPNVGGLGKCKKRKHDSPDLDTEDVIADHASIGSAHIVRDVAPSKVMVCLSFDLPRKVAFADPVIVVKG